MRETVKEEVAKGYAPTAVKKVVSGLVPDVHVSTKFVSNVAAHTQSKAQASKSVGPGVTWDADLEAARSELDAANYRTRRLTVDYDGNENHLMVFTSSRS